ncbi:MAG: LOG family protein [Actinomycetota bacterium]|nr:LOG family protein [Actinomycetota bacterium]
MDAAAHGAYDGGGMAVGILPGPDRSEASKWLKVAIPTDMGHARNALVALCADAIIAVSGGYGTLSEIALGLKMGKPVVGLNTWEPGECAEEESRVIRAETCEEAVSIAEKLGSKPAHFNPAFA